MKTAEEISEIAEATGSKSVIAALIFGFAFAFSSSVSNQQHVDPFLFGTFAICSMTTIGLSFYGLIVSSIWFGATKIIIGWKVVDKFNIFERQTYSSTIAANYAIYAAEITLMITVSLYFWVIYTNVTAIITCSVCVTFLVIAIHQGSAFKMLCKSIWNGSYRIGRNINVCFDDNIFSFYFCNITMPY